MSRQQAAAEARVNLRPLILGVLLSQAGMACADATIADTGVIRGIVLNGSRDKVPMGGVQVALRARIQGQFTVVEQTTTNSLGRFQFEELPVDPQIQYIAGANQGEVHYPGPRLKLTADGATADVQIVVYEASQQPNPLVIREHDIVVRPGAGATEIVESMVIDNPSSFCYVGKTTSEPDRAVTMRLSIPPDFDRVTFEKEFFGRRFLLIDGRLSTGIPWPPGQRRLKFTYVVPNDDSYVDWHRPVDLPCSHVRLSVLTDESDKVRCNLVSARSASKGVVTFTTAEATLTAGHEIQLQIGRVPVPMIVYGRWAALTLLVTLVGGTSIFLWGPRRGRPSGTAPLRPKRQPAWRRLAQPTPVEDCGNK